MSRKGLELPTNTLIILAIGIIVMLTLVVFFTTGSKQSTSATVTQNEFRAECLKYFNQGCCTAAATDATCIALVPTAQKAIGTTDGTKIQNVCCNK
ncbi:MAG: hypothetical protein HY366_01410 [Candidatus Aenigmarchaeota archaeon]|nr:hypothetical protein [Candidatus Aenigmarchaeota archaeon]